MAKTILIVEDDPLMNRMYQKIFKFEQYEVHTAGDGEEGLEKARQIKPKVNGLQVLEKLKADPDTQGIPVVMLTNLAGEKDAEAALMKGAIKYIVKSEHDPKQVTSMVKEIIAAHSRDDVPGS